MKKRFMVISAAVMAGILMTGTPEAGALRLAAAEKTQETEGAIRAKAPKGAQKGTETVSETADKEREPQEQAAIDAALADAKLTEEELTGLRIKKDRDDGKTVYEVELYVDAEEYSYEIDADTAKILEQDYEVEDDYDKEPDDPDAMTREDAVQIILDKVEGATEMDIRIKYERDDGKDIYEGSLVYEGTEYEFELNAKDGQILEWSEERY
ncbi:MAG: PepSY domain-containing protein [Lachnospiraceae bacterium]|nr:PepSY domain-containing protein [Lachnospiraceae bacterium]